MAIKYHNDLVQGSDEWFAARCGLLTASEMKLIITPKTLQYASNDKERCHLYELAAQRVTGYVEPHYISDDMIRGKDDEIRARVAYEDKYAPIQDCGFITNDKWGFTLGYSPDGLIGEDGLAEFKSRRQKYQFETITNDAMPDDFRIQVQTGLLVSERKWCDFGTYCGGMFMFIKRIEVDQVLQDAILLAAKTFDEKLKAVIAKYNTVIADPTARLIPTERVIEKEMFI